MMFDMPARMKNPRCSEGVWPEYSVEVSAVEVVLRLNVVVWLFFLLFG
jgi:hypothetical protein